MKKFRTDAIVQPDAARDVLHVGSDFFTEVGDLVNESDLRGQERIRGVLDHLGRAPSGIENRCGIEVERTIHFRHYRLRPWVLDSNDDTVWMLEVLDGRAFAQELGVGDDRHVGIRSKLADDTLDLVAGADWDRGLYDHHGEAVQFGRNLGR